MSSLKPRDAYTKSEIEKLYPNALELQMVQILMRHGERTPVSARFKNAGLPVYWPYCSVARSMSSATMMREDISSWSTMQWRRRIETFGADDGPVIAAGSNGEIDAICGYGELTDVGRLSAHALGTRLRRLYVDQLGFMPSQLENADMIYLRATAVPRALESMQEAFWGMYPAKYRSEPFPPPTIITRALPDENLFPNEHNCRRFASLSRAFATRSAKRWNSSEEVEYLNALLGKWMPEDSKRIQLGGHPRMSGIMDTVNSTLAHSKQTRLPKEFYDPKARDIMDKIVSEEWFSGFKESREYRALGVGSLMGDIVSRMVGSVEFNGNDGSTEIRGSQQSSTRGIQTPIKLTINGCHDTTLAGVLAGIGTFENGKWPPYTSHIAIEMFKRADVSVEGKLDSSAASSSQVLTTAAAQPLVSPGRVTSSTEKSVSTQGKVQTPGIARRALGDLSTSERAKLDGFFVRIRYNDEIMAVPGCKKPGNHLDGHESFCTLAAFKHIVDKYTPKDWAKECKENLDAARIPERIEPAGY